MHCAIAVSTAVLEQSHKDNVRCTADEEQPEAKEVQLSQPSSTSLLIPCLPSLLSFWFLSSLRPPRVRVGLAGSSYSRYSPDLHSQLPEIMAQAQCLEARLNIR